MIITIGIAAARPWPQSTGRSQLPLTKSNVSHQQALIASVASCLSHWHTPVGRLFIDEPLINHYPPSPHGQYTMSAVPSTSTPHSKFASIFNAALQKYNRKANQDLAKHPLLPRLQYCHSPDAILAILREQTPESNQSQSSDGGLTQWVTPTVNVLYSFSATLGGVVGLVNIRIFSYDIVQPNTHFPGIPTR